MPANKDSPPPRPRTHSTQLLFCQTCNFFFCPPHCRRGLIDSNKAPTSPGPRLRLSCFHRGRTQDRASCTQQPRTTPLEPITGHRLAPDAPPPSTIRPCLWQHVHDRRAEGRHCYGSLLQEALISPFHGDEENLTSERPKAGPEPPRPRERLGRRALVGRGEAELPRVLVCPQPLVVFHDFSITSLPFPPQTTSLSILPHRHLTCTRSVSPQIAQTRGNGWWGGNEGQWETKYQINPFLHIPRLCLTWRSPD